jgi:hypothetical protein
MWCQHYKCVCVKCPCSGEWIRNLKMKIIYFINVQVFTAVVIQIVIFRLWRRVVWCVYGSASVRNSVTSFRVAVRRITMQSNYTGGSRPTVTFQYSCANGMSRLCATLYFEVAGKLVTQTIPHHFDPAGGGSKFLRDVSTPLQHYTVSQNPNSAQFNSFSFCCSLSPVRKTTAAACDPLNRRRKWDETGGLPAHGEWSGNPLLPDNIPVKVTDKRSVYMKCQWQIPVTMSMSEWITLLYFVGWYLVRC